MTVSSGGNLPANLMHFARVLRDAGLPVGPDRVIDALRAVEIAGIGRRDDFYWTLASVLLNRREQFELFDQAFRAFWNARFPLERNLPASPRTESGPAEPGPQVANRIAEALGLVREIIGMPLRAETVETGIAASAIEKLRRQDFNTMTTDELAQARQLLAGLRLPIPKIRTRRLRPDSHGPRVDLRATLRAGLRGNADAMPLQRRAPHRRHPPLVVLCDVSGSMSRYSRMFLHFLHAITNDRDRVHTFLFGTRLTNISRHLRHRDADIALDAVAKAVADWSGGTRIGATLKEFNLRWSRRVLGQNAVVLLISDGLDRDAGADLTAQMDRLHKSCHRLIWLNPLLRFEGFEPKAAGVRAMLPHVDAFLPAHNIDSLSDLAQALAGTHQNQRRTEAWK